MTTIINKELLPEGDEESTIIEIAEDEKLKNYTITVNRVTVRGDNYMGLILGVQINGDDENGDAKELNLVLKHSPRTGIMRDVVPTTDVYTYEIHAYTKYLPQLFKLHDKYNIKNGLFPVAKLYKYSMKPNDEFLIMENMKAKQFQMIDRKVTLDYDHCRMVLQQMAYLHGLSFVLRNDDEDIYNSCTSLINDHVMVGLEVDTYKQHVYMMIDKAAAVFDQNKEQKYIDKLNKLKDGGFEYYLRFLGRKQNYDEKYAIVLHGDCWNNNILFKYNKETNKLEELCLLDWQLTRIASPAIDLSYFFYMCTGSEILENHFDDLINHYYNKLSDIIGQCDQNVNTMLPISILHEHISKYFGYGLLFACQALPMFTSESDEIPEISKIEKLDDDAFKQFYYESKNQHLYVERIRAVVKHAVDNNFI